jgi:2-polyprenyl-3-methyl-5-hydroxy-6-metoxy-1,4-benzoquinol methylase
MEYLANMSFEDRFEFSLNNYYENLPSHKAFRRRFEYFLNKSKFQSLDRLIEIGAGNGEFANFLSQKGFNISVVEPSSDGQAVIKEKYPHLEIVDSRPYEPITIPNCEGKKFFFSFEVIEHCFDPHLFLESIFKSMEEGEYLLLSTPYHGYLKNLAISLLNRWDDHFTVFWKNGHIKFFSFDTISRMCKIVGFEIDSIEGYGRFPFFWRGMFILVRKPLGS